MTARHGLEIRSLAGADSGGLSELLAAVGRSVDARRLEDRIARLLASPGAALVASTWRPPAGVIVVQWSPDLLADAPVARLDLLLVDPETRRCGVGRLLLKAAAQAARQAGCRELHAHPPTHARDLRAFCLASGFEAADAGFVRPLRRRA